MNLLAALHGRYVAGNAPSSRWDVSAVYAFHQEDMGGEDEDEDEDEDADEENTDLPSGDAGAVAVAGV
jgi:hypothetical protein